MAAPIVPQNNDSIVSVPIGPHTFPVRVSDGYVNATELCRLAGKRWFDYRRSASTTAYLEALGQIEDIPVESSDENSRPSCLIDLGIGGSHGRDTYIHPEVATHLAQWLSPEFAVWVSKLVRLYASGKLQTTSPAKAAFRPHAERMHLNAGNVPEGHFLLHEALLKDLHYHLMVHELTWPAESALDSALGRMLMVRIRELDMEWEIKRIPYNLGDHRGVRWVNAYPNHLWAEYRSCLEAWKRERGPAYFSSREWRREAHALGIRIAIPSDDAPHIA